MPVVPRYEQTKVETQSGPTPQLSARFPDEAFNIGASRSRVEKAQSGLINTVENVVLHEKKKADEVRLLEADQALSEFQTNLEYGQDGIYSKKGRDTLEIYDAVKNNWGTKVSEISDSLSDEDQKNAFKERSLRRWDNLNTSMQRHTFSEVQKYDQSVFKSFLSNSQNEAMESFADPARIKQSINDQITEINKYAARNGVDEETKKDQISDSLNKTHALVISKMTEAGNDQLAKFYFESNKDQITGEAEIQIGKMLEVSYNKGESQRQTDKIIGTSKGEGESIAKAKEITDVDIRDATVKRIKDYYSTQEQIKNRNEEDLHKYASNIVLKNGGNMDAVPDSVKANMSPSARVALGKYAEFVAKGQEPPTKWGKYTELMAMASNPDTREKFKDLKLMTAARPYLDDSKYAEIVRLQDGVRKGSSKTTGILDAAQGNQAIIDQQLEAVKIFKTDDVKYEQANRAIYDRVNDWQTENKRKIPNSELRKIVDDELTESIVGKKWFGLADKKQRKFQPRDVEAEPAQQAKPQVIEVERKNKDGRIGIFDSNTKTFLRWK